jgi:hypothetical protein
VTKATVTVPVYIYCSNDEPRLIEVPAHVVGRLAIHRSVHWFRGQEPKASDKYWTVSHIATGLAVDKAMPQELREQPNVRVRDLKSWAEYWQRNPNVKILLDAADKVAAAGDRFGKVQIDDATLYACREAGWRYPQPQMEYDL